MLATQAHRARQILPAGMGGPGVGVEGACVPFGSWATVPPGGNELFLNLESKAPGLL